MISSAAALPRNQTRDYVRVLCDGDRVVSPRDHHEHGRVLQRER